MPNIYLHDWGSLYIWDLQLGKHLSPSIHSILKLLSNQMLISKGKEGTGEKNWFFQLVLLDFPPHKEM